MTAIAVFSTTAMKSAIERLAPDFERTHGHRIVVTYGPFGRFAKEVEGGSRFDAAIVNGQGLAALTASGELVRGSDARIAQSGLGVAVPQGAGRPDISTVTAFTNAMRAAKAIAMTDPDSGGQSGIHLARTFDALGIADMVKPKLRYGQGGPTGLVGLILARGEADIGIQQIPELKAVPGIDLVGPLPEAIQCITTFSAGVLTASTNRSAAAAMISFLIAPQARALIEAEGFDLRDSLGLRD